MASNKDDEEKEVLVPLLPIDETNLTMGLAPIVTVTWFEGDHDKAHSIIRKRMIDIIQANPWLQGKIVRNGENNQACILYSTSVSDSPTTESPFGDTLVYVQDPEPIIKYGELQHYPVEIQEKFMLAVKKDMEQPLWKVSIVPCADSPADRFAVFVTLSHVVGDGHTFYRLYNMLVCGEPIKALTVERVEEAIEKQLTLMKYRESCVGCPPKFLATAAVGMAKKLLSRDIPETRTFLVDMDKLGEMKKSGKGDCAYVSSNDVIFSWFVNQTRSLYSSVIVNMRKHVKEFNDDLVGNYSSLLRFKSSVHAADPSSVRKHVSGMNNIYLPWSSIFYQMSIVTNWSSFAAEHTALDGCSEMVHMPVPNMPVESTPLSMSFAGVYRVRPGQLAVMIIGTPDRIKTMAPFESNKSLF